jgi:hypothetical protein
MLNFSELSLNVWRQFETVSLDLTRQVTILTGQNGCGKTTLLNLLNRHFGWSLNFVSTPYFGRRRQFFSDFLRTKDESLQFDDEANPSKPVGFIRYSNGQLCELTTNAIVQAQYQINYLAMQAVEGMHIPSHRPVATYNNVPNIPTDPTSATQQYQQFQQLLIQTYGGGGGQNPGRIQKQSIISLAVFGEGNSTVHPNHEMRAILDGFQNVLRKVMPPSIGFRYLEIRMPEVVCVTDTGDFALDAMSGGVNAIFSIAWQIHMFGHDKQRFVITIDEPENHLHPSMQRTLLPNLAAAFPQCRIIAATHSPSVVSSFPDANIYALARNPNGRIVSHLLDTLDVSGTPNDVLREILDVRSNLPVWVEEQISRVIDGAINEPAEERARIIMRQLELLGIADAISEYKRGGSDAKDH